MLAYKVLFYKNNKVISNYGNTEWGPEGIEAECKEDPFSRMYRLAFYAGPFGKTSKENDEDTKGNHSAPHFNCNCGIHGVRFRYDLNRWMTDNGADEQCAVVLIVELSGRIIEHDLGYRAEKARPIAVLDYIHNYPPLMRQEDRLLIYTGYAYKTATALQIPVHDFLAYPEEFKPPLEAENGRKL